MYWVFSCFQRITVLNPKDGGVPAMDQKTLLVKKQAILDGVKAARKELENS